MLKYECDMCHEVNVPADSYGPGVMPNGKSFSWVSVIGGQTVGLEIMPTVKVKESPQICGKCVKTLVKEMMAEVWPEPVMIEHYEGTVHPSTEMAIAACEVCQENIKMGDRTYHVLKDLPRDSSSDSDVREVRAEPEVPESSTTNSPATEICRSCLRLANQRPGRDCSNPGAHIYAY